MTLDCAASVWDGPFMRRLARSRAFWWTLFAVAAAVVLASFVREVMDGFDNVGLWFTMAGSIGTAIGCRIQLRYRRRPTDAVEPSSPVPRSVLDDTAP